MTPSMWDLAARHFEPQTQTRPTWATPGDLAKHINPRTVQTPALDLIDAALVRAFNTPDSRLIISMPPQEGKALALDTPVPTPTGWTTMGQLRPGDQVFAGDGKPCRVTWVSPVWTGRDCYQVTTTDGERIVADAAHEWVAQLTATGPNRVYETTDLARPRAKNARVITNPTGLDLPAAQLPMDPYVLGIWLGDGHTSAPMITSHPDDTEVRDRCASAGWPLRHCGRLGYTMTPEGWTSSKPSPARAALKSAGVLGNKHIPDAYLRASREQRLALLQGLIDSDGYVSPKGQVEFCSINRSLADGVRELVYSLGAKAVLTEGRATLYGRDCGPKYRVRFYLNHAAHLTRKATRCKDSSVASVRYINAEPCQSAPTVCIEVDSPNHTFLAGRTMLPTHNSTRGTGDFPVWVLTQRPETRIVTASYAQSLANRNGRAIRRRITDNPDLGLAIAPDNGSIQEWELDKTGQRGGVLSVGVEAGVTGRAADCVSGDTYIECEYGTLTAAEAFARGITRIRAYDHATGRAVWRDVEAARRIPGRRVVDVVTESGRVLTCTPDHRVYTGRGYVPAGSLRRGDSLVALVAPGRVPVRKPAGRPEDGFAPGRPAGAEPLLLDGVCNQRHGRLPEDEPLHQVLGADSAQPQGHLFGRVREIATRGGAPAASMPAVWCRVPAEVLSHEVLHPRLRQRCTLGTDARTGQLALQDGDVLRQMVPVDAAADPGARRPRMRGLLGNAGADLRSGRQDRAPFGAGDSPHRRGRHEQPAGQPHHLVHDLPCCAPQVETDAVAVVRSRGDETVDVYDFQVAGTSNFFGDGLLVHNCLIIDDPIKDRAQADSDVYRENVWDWWTDAASSRLAPGAPVILILTRWHHDDLAGRLLERDAEAGWEVLNIPAQADYDPSKGETDVLGRAPGEYMLSARGRTQAQWEQRKATAGSRSWEALYQGNPTPGTGDILKSAWWQTWDAAPYLERDDGARIIPDLTDVELVQSWDMTFKGTSTSDFVVGQVWMRRGNRVWLLDQVRGRWSFTETVRQVRALTARWPQAIRKLVEDKANGPAVITSLQSQLGGFVPVEPEGSKSSRAEAISPVVEAGQVLLPPVETHPWVGEFVDEAASFPAGKHDDQVDAATQAIHRLLIVPLLAGMTLEATDVLGDDHALDLDWADDTY